jgi:type I restriction enzyme M protein
VRAYFVSWFKGMVDIAADLGCPAIGTQYAILTYRDQDDAVLRRERLDQARDCWREVAEHAAQRGLSFLFWEPMSVGREIGHTIAETALLQDSLDAADFAIPLKVMVDIDHGDVTSPDPADTDPYAWAERFATRSPIIHIKQSSANKGSHWPFAAAYNSNGRVIPEKLLAAIRAGGGESNIRRYIIENDWLDCIVQLPNNLFYNTGITTYIWFLSNHKEAKRKGKVMLIDVSQRFAKLRKNLGAKNCELTAEHVREIQNAYMQFTDIVRTTDDSLAAKVFHNTDFGYYKVTIERPARLKAQFTEEKISELRFDKSLKEPMQWAYEQFGQQVYTQLSALEKPLLEWCEKSGLDLNAKKRKELISTSTWEKQQNLIQIANRLMQKIGSTEYRDYNLFSAEVERVLQAEKIKCAASELNQILNAVSWYDESAEKVVKKIEKISGDKLARLLQYLDCTTEELPDYGYFPTGKKDEYLRYESQSDLRDSENVPLNESIHDYFLREVKPHVDEAWIDLDKTKIGYEISFNKYFYQHKPLRSIEEVSAEILALDKESDGLIMDILNLS